MRYNRLLGIALLLVFILMSVWYLAMSWKPGPNDLVLLNSSGFSFVINLRLIAYDQRYPSNPTPYEWIWETEFWLENRYEKELELHVVLEIDGNSTASDMEKEIAIPSGEREKVELRSHFVTGSRSSIPQGVYRIFASAEIDRKQGVRVESYKFEWDLATGSVNHTTRTIIPDNVPGESQKI